MKRSNAKDPAAPSAVWLLGRLIHAFQLDDDGTHPDLQSAGLSGPMLQGTRPALPHKARAIADQFSRAVVESGIFLPMHAALGRLEQMPRAQADIYAASVGSDGPPLDAGDNCIERLRERLLWAMQAHEQLCSACRSQGLATQDAQPFSLVAPLRFAAYHIGVACAQMADPPERDRPDPQSPQDDPLAPDGRLAISWSTEHTELTPIRDLARRCGLAAWSDAKNAVLGGAMGMNDKTFDNLWSTTADLPNLGTMLQAIEALIKHGGSKACINRQEEFRRWRRWYGLRSLAQDLAAVTYWDLVTYLVNTTLGTWVIVRRSMASSELEPAVQQRRRDALVWMGWRAPVIRWLFKRMLAQDAHDRDSANSHLLDDMQRRDLQSIVDGDEANRLLFCLQSARRAAQYAASCSEDLHRPAAECRQSAFNYLGVLHGDPARFAGSLPEEACRTNAVDFAF